MTYLLYGAAGALLILGLLSFGAVLGWKAKEFYGRYVREQAAQEATEEQRRILAAQQQAFESMLNYNQDTAYGLGDGAAFLRGGDGA